MEFLVLGPLRAGGPGGGTVGAPKVTALLAVLLVRAGETVSFDELIDELWPEGPPRRARAALHVYVSQLRRRVLPPEGARIVTGARGYALVGAVTDAARLERLRGEAVAASIADPVLALDRFSAAAALFRGPVLAGVPYGPVAGAFARWAEECRLECLEGIASCALRAGRHRELVGDLTRWVEEHPLNETLREQLMLALHRSGRRAEALAAFHQAERVLRTELGIGPRAAMLRLRSQIADEAALPVAG
ncbi:DNA-binding SARP family transcriptional activator [Actinocorallia herbida]|uniref:DNA-binding SARP family transcriptional activator n=1 Tax=Actinocorallia herbida TaxID=58109 RepID=A0A3N1CXZ3_9ACTN|nr:AfsR/SARP family transcriptional regulator [Actinocorallia herbida]ROO85598.1 DNA-binding SARP family transcriptional activator [Actinocorallia herbida]